MLKKENCLIKRADFTRVFKQGRSYFTKSLGVKVLKNNLTNSRFGIVVSLKIDKRATKRNLLKRRLRDIIQANLTKIKPGYDFLIITLPPVKDKSFRQISQILINSFKKLRVID